MSRKPSLADFQVKPSDAPSSSRTRAAVKRKPAPPARNFVTKTFELTPEAAREFDILRAEVGVKSYQLAGEALNLLFKKHGKPQVG